MRKDIKIKETVKVSLYLDTRRQKDNGTYPVRIRVYDSSTRKARLYTTDFDLTEENFNRIFHTEIGQRLKKEEKEIQTDLLAIESTYKEKAEEFDIFNFEAFEKLFEIKRGDAINVFWHFESLIKEMKESNRFGTALTYESSLKSLKSYLQAKNGKDPKQLHFQEITVKFLESYEAWMTETQQKSSTTVGIYLRALRVILNKAIDLKIIDKEFYPFGKRKYEIPASRNIKKAFNTDQLTKLFQAVPKIEEQEKAKDYWFFSFVCNGMNIKDIVYLKWKNIHDGQIEFVREKTKRTKKAKQKTIQVPLTDFAKSFIEKYGNSDRSKNSYVFPIINDAMSEEEKDLKKRTFTRFINQHLKNLAKDNGLNEDVSTYWARHSFATKAIRDGASLENVRELLDHEDLKTTMNYFAGFEDKTKKDLLENITDFMRK
ncbi:tyrosine-type recombinase/integrase [Cecembia lonarensis]|uniref:Site-specific tyrosine recombinase XerD n=1 Tax=Cecembia lonarensis (strain CCUG 58316 / KCTC 22772 / LW9) TaxID=1225176 RepID=K1KXV5_CECL9|nr:site-specific integrase [Cecembia lonarensis]EKB47276.1 site-specific tyrosine recombinase XerD [Cecembia lonarensis LW9]